MNTGAVPAAAERGGAAGRPCEDPRPPWLLLRTNAPAPLAATIAVAVLLAVAAAAARAARRRPARAVRRTIVTFMRELAAETAWSPARG